MKLTNLADILIVTARVFRNTTLSNEIMPSLSGQPTTPATVREIIESYLKEVSLHVPAVIANNKVLPNQYLDF